MICGIVHHVDQCEGDDERSCSFINDDNLKCIHKRLIGKKHCADHLEVTFENEFAISEKRVREKGCMVEIVCTIKALRAEWTYKMIRLCLGLWKAKRANQIKETPSALVVIERYGKKTKMSIHPENWLEEKPLADEERLPHEDKRDKMSEIEKIVQHDIL